MQSYKMLLHLFLTMTSIWTVSGRIISNLVTNYSLPSIQKEHIESVSISNNPNALQTIDFSKTGIKLESGYEGYLIPTYNIQAGDDLNLLELLTSKSGFFKGIKLAVPKILKAALNLVYKLGVASVISGLLFAGALIATTICNSIPVCINTFAGYNKHLERSVRAYLSPERVTMLSDFVNQAIEKYESRSKSTNN